MLGRRIGLWIGLVWLSIGGTLLSAQCAACRLYCSDEDRALFQRYLLYMEQQGEDEVAERVIRTARFFLGTPYVAATLEREPEGLVVNLREMDCTTFVEQVLALSGTVQEAEPTFEHFCDRLRTLRYRNGEKISDYTDRLHYITDWIYENARRGLVEDVTAASGGIRLPLSLSFMSTHPDAYKALKGNGERIRKIAELEQEISERTYYYIPQDAIDASASFLKEGDVVCFVTSIPGLDVTHLGLVCREGEKLTFIHASSEAGQVIVSKSSLSDYVKGIKRTTGIIVVRPL